MQGVSALCYAGFKVLGALLKSAGKEWCAKQRMSVQLHWMPSDTVHSTTEARDKVEGTD